MIHVDWLSIYQEFQGEDYPLLASETRLSICALTGEILKQSTIGYQHLGSFDSCLLIKFDKGVLSMDGNPSHWNKVDNLFGCPSVQDAVLIFNEVLESLGYPQFYDCEDTYLTSMPSAHSTDYIHSPGLHITRVDLTENYSSPIHAIEMLKYLSTNTYRGESGFLYPNGRTVEWLGTRSGDTKSASKHLYFKYYDKSFDVELKLNKLMKKRDKLLAQNLSDSKLDFDSQMLVITDAINYLTKLLEYCQINNVIRFELELKSKKINELGLNKLGRWTRDVMLKLVDQYTPHTKQTTQYNKKVDLYSQLIALGIKDAHAKSYSKLGQMWLDGHDLHFQRNITVSKSSYYRTRTALLKLGFDIASPLNVVNFPAQVCTVQMSKLERPGWYREAA